MANANKSNEVNFKNEIFRSGWILKKSKHIKNYRKRWVLLKGSKLICYKNKRFKETDESPTEVFDLSLHKYRIDKHKTVKEKFYLIDQTITASRTFKCFSEKDRNEWVYLITNSISISREISFDKLYVNTTNVRATGFSISATFESEIGSKSIQDLHDSESEESDNDFGGYIVSIITTNGNGEHIQPKHIQPKHVQNRRRTVSKRKENHQINEESFRNFRVESLTIDTLCDIPDFSDESDDEKLVPLVEENEDSIDISDTIIQQLKVFGYDINDIINVMKTVIDPNNINEIKDKLDEIQEEKVLEECDRKFIEQQIIITETSYFQGLDTLLTEFIQPIFNKGLINKKYYNQIISSLPQLVDFHKHFLFEMNKVCNSNKETVINVFNKFIMENKQKFIDINIKYICDYQTICGLFGYTFHGNIQLDSFLKEKRLLMLPLSHLLMLPVQRIPNYIYLLKTLSKNIEEKSTDYNDINDAIKMMEAIANEINERKEGIESMSQCLQIQEELKGLKQPIIKSDRKFIQQFIFIKKEIKHQRLFFLFNDILVIANEKWFVKHILQVFTLDIKLLDNKKKKPPLPEFTLVSAGCGSAVYIGQDIQTINTFKKMLGRCRLKIMSQELYQRNNTLGSLKHELGRQALLFD